MEVFRGEGTDGVDSVYRCQCQFTCGPECQITGNFNKEWQYEKDMPTPW